MAKFEFTANTMTCAGRTFPAKYSVTPSGSVMVIVTMPGSDKPARVRFTPSEEAYPAALAAAKGETPAPAEPAQPETKRGPWEEITPETVEAAREESAGFVDAVMADVEKIAEEQPAPAEIEQPATVEAAPEEIEQPAPRTTPEKSFIGETISGKGWRILFDADTQRTRVCFDAAPSDAARAAVEKAGFYFSAAMNSYNKKLTFKAHRAAVALSGELAAICA